MVVLIHLFHLVDSLQVLFSFLDVLRIHILNSEIISEDLLFVNKLFEVLLSETLEVIRDSHGLEFQFLNSVNRGSDLLYSLNNHFRGKYYELNYESDYHGAFNFCQIEAEDSLHGFAKIMEGRNHIGRFHNEAYVFVAEHLAVSEHPEANRHSTKRSSTKNSDV